MKLTYDMVVDFARPNKSNTIIVSEGDVNSRVCHFTLLANKTPMEMLTVTAALVRAVKQDGTVIFGDATILQDEDEHYINEIEYTIPAAMMDESGNITMTVTLLGSDNTQITSFELYLKVRNALYNEDDLVSESDLSGFRDLLNRALIAIQKIEVMSENTTLPNPYPLNLNIEGTETAYTGSEQVDITLEDMAYISGATDPEDSIDESAAAAAAASALAAATSEYNAGLSEDAAGDSATAAAGSAQDALNAKTAAETARGQAQGYATQAQQQISKLNLPTTAGTYSLKVTVTGGVVAYSWE